MYDCYTSFSGSYKVTKISYVFRTHPLEVPNITIWFLFGFIPTHSFPPYFLFFGIIIFPNTTVSKSDKQSIYLYVAHVVFLEFILEHNYTLRY